MSCICKWKTQLMLNVFRQVTASGNQCDQMLRGTSSTLVFPAECCGIRQTWVPYGKYHLVSFRSHRTQSEITKIQECSPAIPVSSQTLIVCWLGARVQMEIHIPYLNVTDHASNFILPEHIYHLQNNLEVQLKI